jgi:hypothetical protein
MLWGNFRFASYTADPFAHQELPLGVDFVDKPDLERRRRGVGGGFREVKSGRCASSGEGRRRKRDELGQFPQILGGGR